MTCDCNRSFCNNCADSTGLLKKTWICSICRNNSKDYQALKCEVPDNSLLVNEWRSTPYLSQEIAYNGLKSYNTIHDSGMGRRELIKVSADSAFKPVRKLLTQSQDGKLPPISVFLNLAERVQKANGEAEYLRGNCTIPYAQPSFSTYFGIQ